mmetsp:Transcript_41752/g.138417  ORF Transcript_41752/g.138417 Transcript_41752/m.138417 type:complete len:208 (-) Transcript_41752:228-851(-)
MDRCASVWVVEEAGAVVESERQVRFGDIRVEEPGIVVAGSADEHRPVLILCSHSRVCGAVEAHCRFVSFANGREPNPLRLVQELEAEAVRVAAPSLCQQAPSLGNLVPTEGGVCCPNLSPPHAHHDGKVVSERVVDLPLRVVRVGVVMHEDANRFESGLGNRPHLCCRILCLEPDGGTVAPVRLRRNIQIDTSAERLKGVVDCRGAW